MCLVPPLLERGMEPAAELDRHGVRLAFLVKRDGLADVVHDHLARVAASHMLLELFADGRVHRAVHVFVQGRQQFRALHIPVFLLY